MFKFAIASLLAFAAFAVAQAPAPANDPSINTPASLVECQPAQISWNASKDPVYVAIIPGGQPGAAPLKDFGVQPAGTKMLTWKVNIKQGTSITCQVKDAAGAVAYSANVIIQKGSDNSCIDPNATVPAAPSSSAAASAPAASPSRSPDVSAPAGTSAAATTPAGTTHAAASGASSRAPATATSATPASNTGVAAANGALPGAQIGWTALIGGLAALVVA